MPQDQPDNLKPPAAPPPVGAGPMSAAPVPPDDDGSDVFDFIMDSFAALPEPVRNHLNSAATSSAVTKAFDEAGLKIEERDLVYALLLQVFFGLVTAADFAGELKRGLDWPAEQDEKSRRLAVALMGHVMLPARAFLGDVVGLVAALGGNLDDFTESPLEIRTITFTEGAQMVADQVPDKLDSVERSRLRHLIEARLRDVRDDFETKAMLMRPKKVGGLEMDDAAAEKVMETVRSEMRLTKYVEGDQAAATVGQAPAAVPTVPVVLAAPAAVPDPSPSAEVTSTPVAQSPEPVIQPAPKELDAKAIKALYLGSEDERGQVAKRVAKFREVTGDDPAKQRDALFEILYPPDLGPVEPLFVVAGALAMAEDGTLIPALTEDLRFQDIVSKYLVDRQLTGQSFRFSESPSDPEFMNVFLQLILRGFAELPEGEAARFGLRVANAAKKAGFGEYSGLTAFDADDRAFRWLEPIEL